MSLLRRLLAVLGIRRRVKPEQVVWMDDTMLLIACRLGDTGDGTPQGWAQLDGREHAVVCIASPPDPTGARQAGWCLLLVELPAEAAARRGEVELGLRLGPYRMRIDGAVLADAFVSAVPVADALREAPPAERKRLHHFLFEACRGRLDRADGATLAGNMRVLRDALRLQLPLREITGNEPLSAHVDCVLGVDEGCFWIKGWISDPKSAVSSVTAISPEGARVDLLDGAFRYQRRDVQQLYAGAGLQTGEKHGLVNCVHLEVPSRVASGWIVELRNNSGGGVEAEAPVAVRDPLTVRDSILGDTNADSPRSFELCERLAYPALTRLQERARGTIAIEDVIEHGSLPDSPAVSVIIPLYGRIDFVQHQFAQFAHDPELRGADLIYVLDEPQLAADLHLHASELHEFYGFPFRVVVLNRHAGYPGANNLAASVARGRLLALVNSDVFPVVPGWIGTMTAFHEATPDVGALGVKLLYEDGSLQHAGLMFQREVESGLWGNQHYYKGYSREFPAANVARPVPAVTGACMMIQRELYERLGGMSDAYVMGGYDDSDLCLRLIEAGRTNWYLPQVELYHLEDQSFPAEQRELVTRYNMWLQTHLWGDRIEQLMRSTAAAPPEKVGETLPH